MFVPHDQWELYQYEAVDVKHKNPTDGKTYDEVQIILYLRRKPQYYLITVVVPVLIIAISEMSIFMIPVDHENKIEISLQALWALGIFM